MKEWNLSQKTAREERLDKAANIAKTVCGVVFCILVGYCYVVLFLCM